MKTDTELLIEFATAALEGSLASDTPEWNLEDKPEKRAKCCFDLADAMLAEFKKRYTCSPS